MLSFFWGKITLKMSLLSPQKKLKERKGGIGELVVKRSQQSTETSINQALPQFFFSFSIWICSSCPSGKAFFWSQVVDSEALKRLHMAQTKAYMAGHCVGKMTSTKAMVKLWCMTQWAKNYWLCQVDRFDHSSLALEPSQLCRNFILASSKSILSKIATVKMYHK